MSVPVISVAQMRAWEEFSWAAGRSQAEVIENAGKAVAQQALEMTEPEDRILILAGKGHNGDDARAAQPHLVGRKVRLLNVLDAGAVLEELNGLLLKRPALVIDGLFGIGLNRPLDPAFSALIESLNRANLSLLAVDVPSGLNADSGLPQKVAVNAQATVTFGAPKYGLLRPASYAFTGRLIVATDIGLIPHPFEDGLQWTTAEDFACFPPVRRVDGHKGTFGHAVILAGSQGYHGAAVLAARGALRACPGLVSVVCDPVVYQPIACQLQAAMVHPFAERKGFPETGTALVIGPGLAAPELGASWRSIVEESWRRSSLPVVVDASALDWLPSGVVESSALRLVTPHPGEAARMLNRTTDLIQQDRPGAVREISARYGDCWVVLKGHQTLAGRSTGEVYVNPSGNPFLAQGGSGDVLAGFLGGLLAQRELQAEPLKTIRYGVWAHGIAADILTARNRIWTIEDLVKTIGDTAN